MNVKILPTTDTPYVVSLKAAYLYNTPVSGICATAPVWKATRRGLTPNATDLFRASIARESGVRTTVTATAPSGAAGNVSF